MTEREFTKILVDLSGDIGEIKAEIKQVRQLHEQCPARLGFDAIKEKTSKIRHTSDTAIPIPKNIGSIKNIILAAGTGLLLGAAFVGYLLSKAF